MRNEQQSETQKEKQAREEEEDKKTDAIRFNYMLINLEELSRDFD